MGKAISKRRSRKGIPCKLQVSSLPGYDTHRVKVGLRSSRSCYAGRESQTALPEGEGSGGYMFSPEGEGAALPSGQDSPGAAATPDPQAVAASGALISAPTASGANALPVRAGTGTAHRVLPGRGRPHRADTGGSSAGHSQPKGRSRSGGGATSCPWDRTCPGELCSRSCFLASGITASGKPFTSGLQIPSALRRAARLSARRRWRVVSWDA